jgi:hypothetical protein
MELPTKTRHQIESAYEAMAAKAKYRPAAPSDGLGNIAVPIEELNLHKEAAEYARDWWKEEDNQSFHIGCCDEPTRPATIFAIEAARNMCGGIGGRQTALRLLKLAVKELETLRASK